MKFKTIQSQIIVTFVTIIIGIQLIGLIPLEQSINENAYRSAEQDLKVGEGVFKNILEQNTANLKQGAKYLPRIMDLELLLQVMIAKQLFQR